MGIFFEILSLAECEMKNGKLEVFCEFRFHKYVYWAIYWWIEYNFIKNKYINGDNKCLCENVRPCEIMKIPLTKEILAKIDDHNNSNTIQKQVFLKMRNKSG